MSSLRLAGWLTLAVALGGCGPVSVSALMGRSDAAPDAPAEDLGPSTDTGFSPDTGLAPDTGLPPEDTGAASPDTGLPGPDVPLPPEDVVVVDLPPPTDTGPVVDVPSPVDGGGTCPRGLNETCPTSPPGPCPDLADGVPHAVTFTGLRHDVPLSCAGSSTSVGPDGVLPLTLTTMSDVTLTGQPTGGDAVVVGLFSPDACGVSSGELRCSNSSSTGSGGTARVTFGALPAGRYYVAVASARGNPATVQAAITPSRPRPAGDVCPGVTLTPDRPATSVSTAGFAESADVGTTCGSNGSPSGWVDAVFSYTLTTARDVTLTVSSPSAGGDLRMDVSPTCGMRASALPTCTSNNPNTRTLRNQAPGTYYVTVEYRGGAGRSISAQVTTSAPTTTPSADRCPGRALTEGTIASVTASTLARDYSLPCLSSPAVDAVFSFVAPSGRDVMVAAGASDARDNVALQLQATCGGAAVGACVGAGSGRTVQTVWQRYRGLTAGATYYAVVSSTDTVGELGAQYVTVPAATPMAVTGNDTCTSARTIPESGGVFTGSTSGAGSDYNPSSGCAAGSCGMMNRDVVYRLDLTTRRRVVFSTTGSGYDTVLYVQSGSRCPGNPISARACNDDTLGTDSQVDLTLDPGTYWVIVDGCSASGSYTLDVAVLPP